MEITIHEIEKDGLPAMDKMIGRVAFIFDGSIVSGWPLAVDAGGDIPWEADSGVGKHGKFYGVTHWIELPVRVWDMTAAP